MKLQRGVQFFGSITILLTAGAMDRFLKMAVELERFKQAPIGWRYFAFEQFHNTGVAFSIPIPLWFVLPLTVVFLIALLMCA